MSDVHTAKTVKRGYVPTDAREFGIKSLDKLRRAAEEVYFLLNRGYSTKTATTFVGNHHLLSERQRLALARAVSSECSIELRKHKELSAEGIAGKTLYIDGFNTIITLEIACSESTLLKCMDGTIRDLAGLRGTYSLIDKTDIAVKALADAFERLHIEKAVIYLDAPVSNSGRLRNRILDVMADRPFSVEVYLENAVDAILKTKESVVTADAIILDACGSWYNLTKYIIQQEIGDYPFIDLCGE